LLQTLPNRAEALYSKYQGEKIMDNNNISSTLSDALFISPSFEPGQTQKSNPAYDPEMLYVECNNCGKPIVWEPGRTTELLIRSNINPSTLDEHCLILSDGCKECMPYSRGYSLSIVRLAGISLQDLLLLQKTSGHA
jgi:hypothetical protein